LYILAAYFKYVRWVIKTPTRLSAITQSNTEIFHWDIYQKICSETVIFVLQQLKCIAVLSVKLQDKSVESWSFIDWALNVNTRNKHGIFNHRPIYVSAYIRLHKRL